MRNVNRNDVFEALRIGDNLTKKLVIAFEDVVALAVGNDSGKNDYR